MPSLYNVKPRFVAPLRPATAMLASAGVTANQLTVLAAALSCGLGFLLAMRPDAQRLWLLLPIFLAARMTLNAIDGILAREHGLKSPRGAVLNELGDVISDSALYLPFALHPGVTAAWVVLAVVLAIMTEMAGVVAVQIGAKRRYDGPLGKSDRAALFGGIGLVVGLGVAPGAWFDGLMMVAAALLALTIVNRCRLALREVAGA